MAKSSKSQPVPVL